MDDLELTCMSFVLLVLFVLFGFNRPNQWSVIRLFLDLALLTMVAFFAVEMICLK